MNNNEKLKPLYPTIEPYLTYHFSVENGHALYVEECGNPQGIPVIFLHGGPGSYCKPYHRSFFNPELYHIILFDQRGAGRSTPTGSLTHNTTPDLLRDIEKLRKHLNIEKWVIFGNSWGTTLGLLYAQQHPNHVLGMVLRGIFLARERDLHWFYSDGGVNRLFPGQWQTFMQFLPKGHWDTPLAYYYNQLTNTDLATAQKVALIWANWTSCIVSYGQFPALIECNDEIFNEVRIECHYAFHHFFIQENQIIKNISTLDNIPSILIHGQRDLVCPLENAFALQEIWLNSELQILSNSGHLANNDDEMISAVVTATDKMVNRLEL